MIRAVMDTPSLISLEMIGALKIVAKNIKITIPSIVKYELGEISAHKDKEGKAAAKTLALIGKEINQAEIKDSERVEKMLSKDINRGEAECFVCCLESGIRNLIMDDIDAAYQLEGPAIANGIKIKNSIASLVQAQRQNAIDRRQLKKFIKDLIKTREWEGGALEAIADKYLGKL